MRGGGDARLHVRSSHATAAHTKRWPLASVTVEWLVIALLHIVLCREERPHLCVANALSLYARGSASMLAQRLEAVPAGLACTEIAADSIAASSSLTRVDERL